MSDSNIYIEEEKQPFEITGLSSLTWVFREILTPLNNKIEENKAFAQEEIKRINEWLENENKSSINDVEFWQAKVEQYHFNALLSDPKAKTLSTPYGKSKSVTSKAQPEKTDDEQLLKYAKANELADFIKVVENVKWGDMKKSFNVVGNNVVDSNGEIVPGVSVKPETTTFKTEVIK